MSRSKRAGEAGFLLVALEFRHRRQQRPDAAVLEADEAVAARDFCLEGDPDFEHAVRFRGDLALGDAPVARLHALQAMGEHVADLVAPLHRLDVPGEGDEIAPVAVRGEHVSRGVDVACGQGGLEFPEKGRNPRIGRCVEHPCPPDDSIRRAPVSGRKLRAFRAACKPRGSSASAAGGGAEEAPGGEGRADPLPCRGAAGVGPQMQPGGEFAPNKSKQNQANPSKSKQICFFLLGFSWWK